MLVTLFGPPGVGKSTIGDWLEAKHGFRHLALGRILKDPDRVAEIGISPEQVAQAIRTGTTITSTRLFDWIDGVVLNEPRPIVVDGYPREPHALPRFNALVDQVPSTKTVVGLHLSCTALTSMDRMRSRGREDDTENLLEQRYDQYRRVQFPLIGQLSSRVRIVPVKTDDALDAIMDRIGRVLGLTSGP